MIFLVDLFVSELNGDPYCTVIHTKSILNIRELIKKFVFSKVSIILQYFVPLRKKILFQSVKLIKNLKKYV